MKLAAKKYNKIFLIYDIQGVRLMIKKIAYLIPACMTLSVAMAEPSPSGTVLLSLNEMDQITAGLSAGVIATAFGYSPVLALTKTSTTATAALTGNGNPGLTGGATIVGGLAQAGAAGNGSSTGTSVTPTTDLTGPNVQAGQLSVHSSGQLVNMSGSAIVSVSAPTTNPL